jgi:exodeoxyribonuclease V beta subunit
MFRDGTGDVAASGKFSPKDTDVQSRLQKLAGRAPGLISVEPCVPTTGVRWVPASSPARPLEAARFGRGLDLAWRRTSYSGIISAEHGGAISSEPEDPGTTDEPVGPGGAAPLTPTVAGPDLGPDEVAPTAGGPDPGPEEARLRQVPSRWADVPGGAEVGTFVHHVLQRTDFTAPDLELEIAEAIAAEAARSSVDVGPSQLLVAGVGAALRTPLGAAAGGRCLAQIGPTDRVDELTFELPLAGGEEAAGEVLTGDIARLFAAHGPPGGALDGYSSRLASPALASHLRGYLTGSLDLVMRVTDETGRARFLVVDYKTNWLATEGEPLSAWHYRQPALDAEMQRDHYPLQAVLYLVALHRYLRWRLPGYDPVTHLGGVLYLFLRGMVGPDAPVVGGVPCGVFEWRPPAPLVTGLSDLLDTGSRRT